MRAAAVAAAWPATVTLPASGAINAAMILSKVVLPAPSGPTRPVSRPASISAVSPSSARMPSNAFTTPRSSIAAGMSAARFPPQRNADGDGHALAQVLVGVGHDDAQAVHEIRAQVGRLDRARRELGARRNEADLAAIAPVARVGRDEHGGNGHDPDRKSV